tara:strand:+ start:91 stop:504 length:414 start_codon:yes stop_codon:yes gene_type:complete
LRTQASERRNIAQFRATDEDAADILGASTYVRRIEQLAEDLQHKSGLSYRTIANTLALYELLEHVYDSDRIEIYTVTLVQFKLDFRSTTTDIYPNVIKGLVLWQKILPSQPLFFDTLETAMCQTRLARFVCHSVLRL